jgi:predicted transglutaminase-like cysteine proteinase
LSARVRFIDREPPGGGSFSVSRRGFLTGAAAFALAPGAASHAAELADDGDSPFDRAASRSIAVPANHPWIALRRRHRGQSIEARLTSHDRPDGWQRLLRGLANRDASDACDRLHRSLHHVAYARDSRTYRKRDFWATPREFLKHGGDCEDFAAAAWLALTEASVPADDLHLIVGWLPETRETHAVTALRRGQAIFVFDNRADKPIYFRLFDTLTPLYSLSENRLWLHARMPVAANGT